MNCLIIKTFIPIEIEEYGKEGRIWIYVNKSLFFKLRPDLSINGRDVESLSIEISFYKIL